MNESNLISEHSHHIHPHMSPDYIITGLHQVITFVQEVKTENEGYFIEILENSIESITNSKWIEDLTDPKKQKEMPDGTD